MSRFAILLLVSLGLSTGSFALAAGSSGEVQRLKVGITVGTDDLMRERVDAFRLALEAALDLRVDLFLMDTMAETVEALANGEIDYAKLSSSAYAALYAKCACVEPLVTARPDAFPGRYHAIVVGRAGQVEPTLQGLKETRLGVQGPQSVAGFRVPLANLAAEGVDPTKHFRTLVRVKDPVDGLQALLDGRVDATTAWSTLAGEKKVGYTAGTLNDYFLSGGQGLERLRVIWQSPPIPYDAHTVRYALPDEFKQGLRSALLALKSTAPVAYFAIEPDMPGGFEPTVHANYEALLRTYEPKNQDLLKSLAK